MSLSRFYRMNPEFQPDSILNRDGIVDTDPVWGESIVKEELPAPEIIPEEKQEEQVAKKPAQETHQEETKIDPPPPPPEPPVPEIDIDALREESFASGVEAGRIQAEEDFENGAQTLLCICNELDKLRELILQNSATEMKELVMDISEKIIRQSVEEQDTTIVATIQDAIQLAVKSDEFQIQVHPDDLKCLQEKKQEIIESISGLENIVFQTDPDIDRGGCKLESTCCTVDASLTSQIKIIRDNVMEDPVQQIQEPT